MLACIAGKARYQSSMAMGSKTALPVIEERDFEREVLRSELPVLVDFYADWCGPCKTMEPDVIALSHELAGKAKVVKVNIDRSEVLSQRLRIQSVPTTMVFHGGRVAAAEVGALRKAQLRQMIEPFLPRAEGAVRAPEAAALLGTTPDYVGRYPRSCRLRAHAPSGGGQHPARRAPHAPRRVAHAAGRAEFSIAAEASRPKSSPPNSPKKGHRSPSSRGVCSLGRPKTYP